MAIIPDQKYALKGSQIEDLASRIGDNTGDIETLEAQIQALATDISLKGSVDDFEHLPADAAIGDAYITEDTGILYVWVGDKWVALNEDGGGATLFYASDQSSWTTSSQIPLYAEKTLTNPIAKPQFMDAAKQGPIILVVVATQDAPTNYYNWDYYTVVFNEDDSMSETLGSLHFSVMGYGTLIQFTWDQTTDPVITDSFSFPNIVQTNGNSTTNVMSQSATCSLLYRNPANKNNIQIGDGANASGSSHPIAIGAYAGASGDGSMALGDYCTTQGWYNVGIGYSVNTNSNSAIGIGYSAESTGVGSIAIGGKANLNHGARASAGKSIAIGTESYAQHTSSVALGEGAVTTRAGEVNIGDATWSQGYNYTEYRVLGGVHDPVNAHDAATKGYVDTAVAGAGVSTINSTDWSNLWQ